ncbi:MAG TPA: hypothetical protein VFU14_19485 [Acidimicrobiales bacterium]|nr:hypothetical protein [Acidimicrobiales bacterium]
MGRRTTIVLGALVLVLAAATAFAVSDTGDGDGGDDGADDRDEQPADTVPPGDVVDWGARDVRLDDERWSVAFCEGDGPFVCFTGADGSSGSVELSSWPAEELDVVADVLAAGGTDAEALDAFVADFLQTFEADRHEGCGPGVEVVREGAEAVPVAGRTGVRYGFRVVRGGETVEHVLGHAVLADGSLHLLNASGLGDDACLEREGEFDISAFDAATVELVGRLAAASVLPGSQAGSS